MEVFEKSESISELRSGLDLLGIKYDDVIINKMIKYAELIYKWNRVYNLTAVRGFSGIISRHILDSLTITSYIEDNTRVIDIGSGAGLPGIPLALVRSDIVVALAECNGRKASFLRQVISDLEMKNIGVVNSRVEEFEPKSKFDVVVSRAYSSLDNLVSVSKPLLGKGGYILSMKGMYPSAELDELYYPYEVFNLQVLNDGFERHLVLVEVDSLGGK